MGPFLHVKVWILGAVTAVVGAAVVAVVYTLLSEPETPPPPAPLAAPAVEPAPHPPAPALAAVEPVAPAFDVVRIAEDGGALVAGSAPAGTAVVLRVDDSQVAQTAADPGGQFVALFSLGPSEAVQILTVEAVFADGRVLRSGERVVLTPRLPPVAAAGEQEPAPAAEPEAEPVAEAEAERIALAEPVAEPEAAPLPPVVQDEGATTAEAPAVAQPPATEAPAAPEDPAPVIAGAPAVPAPDSPARIAQTPPAETPAAEATAETIAGPQAAAPGSAPEMPAPEMPALAAAEIEETPMPRAFVVRESGAVQVLDRAPRVLDNVVVDVISYSDAGEVQLSGRAAQGGTGARLQIYLDNRPVALALAENGDWASDLPDVDPGIYTLRVDEIGPEGRVVSRFETPFQREDPVLVVAARARLAPAQGAPAGGTVRLEAPAAPAVEIADTAAEPASGPAPAETPVTEPAAAPPAEPAAAPATQTARQADEPPVSLITVQPGHSLWRISAQHYGEGARYVVIYQANRAQIRNPDLIYPGQIFVLPD